MSMKTGWVEKRLHERVVATLKVDFRVVDPKESKKILDHVHYSHTTIDHMPELAKSSPLYHAVTRDISMGGLALISDQPFSSGGLVEIGLHLPQYNTILKFLAKVAHTDKFVELGRNIYRAGVQTVAINQADLNRIETYLFKLKLQSGPQEPA